MNQDHSSASLAAVDQQARIQQLRERAQELGGGEMVDWTADDCPLDIQEAFWESVLAFESAPDTTFRELVLQQGVPLTPAAELSNAELGDSLRETIGALAANNVYLTHTDHLDDRALYQTLCDDLLRQPTKQAPAGGSWHCELDVLGGCTREDLRLLMTFYPDDWCYGPWDEEKLGPEPTPHTPPYDRDHWLPKDPQRDELH